MPEMLWIIFLRITSEWLFGDSIIVPGFSCCKLAAKID